MSGLTWPLTVPVLSDGVVTLRAHRPDDVDDVFAMTQDDDTRRWTAIPLDNTREDSEAYVLQVVPQGWDTGRMRGWAIEVEGRFAGNLDIRGEGPVTDVGFALHPWARGRGVMLRALRLAVDRVFTVDGVETVHWYAHVGHQASLRVAHAAGFRLGGTVPGQLHERGQVLDAWSATLRFGDPPAPRSRWAEPVLVPGEAVRLRPMRDDDVPRIVEACSDATTRHWLSNLPHPYTDEAARGYLADSIWQAARGAKATWAVADSATDQLVGTIAVMDMDGIAPDSGEVGYWTHPAARGRGVMSEAAGLVIDHAFSAEGLARRRLTLHAAAGNAPSNAIAHRHGFTRIGTQHQAERLGDGSITDLQSYELLAPQ